MLIVLAIVVYLFVLLIVLAINHAVRLRQRHGREANSDMAYLLPSDLLCPVCFRVPKGVRSFDGQSTPGTGDLRICAYCEAALCFCENMQLREATDDDFAKLKAEDLQGFEIFKATPALICKVERGAPCRRRYQNRWPRYQNRWRRNQNRY